MTSRSCARGSFWWRHSRTRLCWECPAGADYDSELHEVLRLRRRALGHACCAQGDRIMIPSLRTQFNANFTPEKYQAFLQRVDDVCGTHVNFRLSETPCFFPKELIDRMAEDGQELIRQLVRNPAYLAKSELAVPAE